MKILAKAFQKTLENLSAKSQMGLAEQEMLALALISQLRCVKLGQLIILPNSQDAEYIYADLKLLMKLSSMDEYELLYLPEIQLGKAQFQPDLEAQRNATLKRMLSQSKRLIILASAAAITTPVVRPASFTDEGLELTVGRTDLEPRILADKLTEMDYDNEVQVSLPGEFSLRGGIVDVFAPGFDKPCRIEYFDDEIESLRLFDPDTQRSIEATETYGISPRSSAEGDSLGILEYCKDFGLIEVDASSIEQHLQKYFDVSRLDVWKQVKAQMNQVQQVYFDPAVTIEEFPAVALAPVYKSHLPETQRSVTQAHQSFLFDQLKRWTKEKWKVFIFCGNDGNRRRMEQMIAEKKFKNINLLEDGLQNGFLVPSLKQVYLSEFELFGRPGSLPVESQYGTQLQKNLEYEPELAEGDYAVHVNYGVCRYLGTEFTEGQELIQLEFAEDKKLSLPLDSAHLITRYIGGKKSVPKLARLGTSFWTKACAKAEVSARDYAAELLRIQAMREHTQGIAFGKDSEWQELFEASFPYTETEDQLKAIAEVKEDMERPQPMDRLICGDVGFGKTEVAMRAAFKAVMSGYQVAIIVPTTVLAQQHFHSFSQRMADYPVGIACLSRFVSKSEQKKILKTLKGGELDIVIGTHRLLQKDINFQRLGLVVVDEEQRFGVEAKESLKRMRALVDILSMSATPIPRTLYLSMTGLRNFSTILTAPKNRKSVRTIISRDEDDVLEQAISRELERGGQIYYLHNRVGTIDKAALRLKRLFPEANIIIGHGQMNEHELEHVMNEFVEGRGDILVCTTIIESGMDIQNANTIIIDRADRFGLSALYQLRGRVGRQHRQAYCYLLLPKDQIIMDVARERLSAVRKYTHPGAGFKLAMRDLEIRGAGNILGSQQSGHIAAVGFDLYCQLLKTSVEKLKGGTQVTAGTTFSADFIYAGFDAPEHLLANGIAPTYVESDDLRIEFYRRFSKSLCPEEVSALEAELSDRFGRLPEAAEAYVLGHKMRCLGAKKRLYHVNICEGKLILEGENGILQRNRKTPVLRVKTGLGAMREAYKKMKSLLA